MEMQGTDFTVKNRTDVLKVRLGTEEESFDIRIMVPTKGIYEDLLKAAGMIDDIISGESEPSEFISDIYGYISRAMSHNTEAKVITPEFLDDMGFDIADASQFIGDYVQFMVMLTSAKN